MTALILAVAVLFGALGWAGRRPHRYDIDRTIGDYPYCNQDIDDLETFRDDIACDDIGCDDACAADDYQSDNSATEG